MAMENLPLYIPLVFGITVFGAVYAFFLATHRAYGFLWVAAGWIILVSVVGLTGFYAVAARPPRLLFLAGPPVLFGVGYFFTQAGKRFFGRPDLPFLTLFQLVRIPVELVLYWLFVHHAVPRAMTFEGSNYDILSGITAPVVAYLAFGKKIIPKWALVIWNVLCLGLLLNVVSMGVRVGAGQDLGSRIPASSVALVHFPYVLLPGILVPMVVLTHLAALRLLLRPAPCGNGRTMPIETSN
jgi:hypothetical protein